MYIPKQPHPLNSILALYCLSSFCCALKSTYTHRFVFSSNKQIRSGFNSVVCQRDLTIFLLPLRVTNSRTEQDETFSVPRFLLHLLPFPVYLFIFPFPLLNTSNILRLLSLSLSLSYPSPIRLRRPRSSTRRRPPPTARPSPAPPLTPASHPSPEGNGGRWRGTRRLQRSRHSPPRGSPRFAPVSYFPVAKGWAVPLLTES